MNKEQKAAVVEEVAAQIQEAEAVLAVDYRGISVPQAAELRERLNDAGARFRVVKNTLTLRAAEQAGADDLKELLEGPTAFAFVAADGGDVALTAKALSQFRRANDVLVFKGGRMGGEPLTLEQMEELARLPARDVLHGQLVGTVAAPITGLVRGLNALIAGLAIQLRQIAEEGMVPRGEGPAEAAPPDQPAPADEEAEAADQPAPAEEEAEAAGQAAAAEGGAAAAGDAAAAEGAPSGDGPAAEEPSPGGGEAPEEASQEADQAAQREEAAGEAEESSGEGEGGEPSTEAQQEQTSEESPSEGEQKEG